MFNVQVTRREWTLMIVSGVVEGSVFWIVSKIVTESVTSGPLRDVGIFGLGVVALLGIPLTVLCVSGDRGRRLRSFFGKPPLVITAADVAAVSQEDRDLLDKMIEDAATFYNRIGRDTLVRGTDVLIDLWDQLVQANPSFRAARQLIGQLLIPHCQAAWTKLDGSLDTENANHVQSVDELYGVIAEFFSTCQMLSRWVSEAREIAKQDRIEVDQRKWKKWHDELETFLDQAKNWLAKPRWKKLHSAIQLEV